MRKVLLALTLTAVGLTLLLTFKSRSGSTVSALGTEAVQSNPGPTAHAGSGSSPSPSPAKHSTSSAKASSAKASSTAKKPAAGTFTGSAIDTRYGPVKVQAVVAGGKLTGVNVLEVPDNGGYEDQIVAVALPQLKSEALAAQSGNIDIVSGATYTSQGYARSLQAALDKAGM